MGIVKIKQIIKNFRRQSSTGRLRMISLRWTHLLIGSAKNAMEDTTIPIEYIDDNWWMGVRSALQKVNGKLIFESVVVTHANVRNDIAIMDVINNHTLTTREKRIVNNVRIYLQVYYLSEIIHPHLPQIRRCFLECERDEHSINKLDWTRVREPTPSEK